MSEHRSGGFAAGLLVGVLGGVALGILLAPKSGRENREIVLERAPELRTRAPELINRAADQVRERLEEGRAAFRQGQDDARERLEQELREAQGHDAASPTGQAASH